MAPIHLPTYLSSLSVRDACAYARDILATADWHNFDAFTESQLDAYNFVESLYYDGEITYGELWSMYPRRPREAYAP